MNLTLLTTSNTSNDLAVIYTKLSFDKTKNLKTHFEDCKKCLNYTHLKLFKIYNDDSISKDTSLYSRIEFSKLINDAKMGKFSTIIVPSIDRLTRNYNEYLNLKLLLKKLNIYVVIKFLQF